MPEQVIEMLLADEKGAIGNLKKRRIFLCISKEYN
jgi:hypothetical protein